MPDGELEDEDGSLQFIVGTGRAGTGMPALPRAAREDLDETDGVLKPPAEPGQYRREFVPIAGESFTDQGSSTCHVPKLKPLSVAVGSSSNPSTYGDDITKTDTVTSAGSPVSEGAVSFFDGGTCDTPGALLAGPQA